MQEIRSVSLFGLSSVSVYFDDSMDIYFARQLVNERLQQVGDRLPAGYGKPEMGPNTSGLGQVFWYTVERADAKLKDAANAKAPSDMDLRTLQDWTIRLILRTAPGVDDVTSWGGQEKQYQVRIDPLKLIAHTPPLHPPIRRIFHRRITEIGLDGAAHGTHTMRRTKTSLIYRRTTNLRAVQLLLGHSKLESTVRYLGIESTTPWRWPNRPRFEHAPAGTSQAWLRLARHTSLRALQPE